MDASLSEPSCVLVLLSWMSDNLLFYKHITVKSFIPFLVCGQMFPVSSNFTSVQVKRDRWHLRGLAFSLLHFLMKMKYLNLQEQGEVCNVIVINETINAKQEDPDDEDTDEIEPDESLDQMLECFHRNVVASACPNAAKGIFVNLDEARGFLREL